MRRKTWLYVQAYNDLSAPEDQRNDVCFRHAFVVAADDMGAYDAGHEAVPRELNIAVLNDYVVQIPAMALAYVVGGSVQGGAVGKVVGSSGGPVTGPDPRD